MIVICIACALTVTGCGGGGSSSGQSYGDGGGGTATTGTPTLTSVSNLSSSGFPIRPGDWIEVNGSNFGATQGNSYSSPSDPTPNPSPDATPPSPTPSPTTTASPTPTSSVTPTTSPTTSPTPSSSPTSGGGGGGGTPVAPKLAFTMHPSDTVAGDAMAPSVKVAIQDAAGNTMTTATDEITIALNAGGTGAVLSGTLSRKAENGVATFDDLKVNIAGNGYTLTVTSGTLTAASSGAFKIIHGTAAGLAFNTQPANGTAGVTLSQIVVHVVDS